MVGPPPRGYEVTELEQQIRTRSIDVRRELADPPIAGGDELPPIRLGGVVERSEGRTIPSRTPHSTEHTFDTRANPPSRSSPNRWELLAATEHVDEHQNPTGKAFSPRSVTVGR